MSIVAVWQFYIHTSHAFTPWSCSDFVNRLNALFCRKWCCCEMKMHLSMPCRIGFTWEVVDFCPMNPPLTMSTSSGQQAFRQCESVLLCHNWGFLSDVIDAPKPISIVWNNFWLKCQWHIGLHYKRFLVGSIASLSLSIFVLKNYLFLVRKSQSYLFVGVTMWR